MANQIPEQTQTTAVDNTDSQISAKEPQNTSVSQVTEESPAPAQPSPTTALNPEERVILDNAHVLIQQGKKAFAMGEYEAAIDSLGDASQLIGGVVDETSSLVYADVLILYGQALLHNAIEQSALMANQKLQTALSTEAREVAESASGQPTQTKGKIHFEGEPDFRQVEQLANPEAGSSRGGMAATNVSPNPKEETKESEGDEGENGQQNVDEEAEEEDDFSTAWEVLELARLIYSKYDTTKHRLKEADLLLMLGDVSLESENFKQAVEDYQKATVMKAPLIGTDSRELAECYYKIALAQEYASEFTHAIDNLHKVIRILENTLTKLTSSEDPGKDKEVDEIQGLLDEVQSKLDDLNASQARKASGSTNSTDALLQMAFGPASASSGNSQGAAVNDITNLVRSRKAPVDGKGKAPEVAPSTPVKRKMDADKEDVVTSTTDDKRAKIDES
ncbi:hypothetical protein IWQ62_002175 [Dispira parvispora]|uniref:Tetratricopeptide SHNi-TPR domain-containing protein n=1 Tax=Dispira parvispora TaxID=1520584 RepID=A0A9W8E444_9FUNG|nr:hypothetical protein IWQ62_002175 [Dispira parvispora]